jgi:hypothetical protein
MNRKLGKWVGPFTCMTLVAVSSASASAQADSSQVHLSLPRLSSDQGVTSLPIDEPPHTHDEYEWECAARNSGCVGKSEPMTSG